MVPWAARIRAFLSTATLVSLLFCCTAISFSAEIDDIKAAIKSKNAKWNADVTSVHQLDGATRRSRVGLTLPAPTASVPEQTSMASPLSAPTSGFDWRNHSGTNYVTPIKNQGNCGSCWAFAATGALESYTLIHGTYDPSLNLSEQILVSCSGAGSCNGGTLDGAASYIQHTGLPIEKDDPYTATNSSCSAAVSGWTSSTDKIAMWEWISAGTAPSASTIKNAVYTYGPVVVAMNVYSDFYAYRSGIYTHTTGYYEGGHAILVVGYADDASSPGGGYFIVKNSWGTGWGEPFGTDAGGYFRIGYSELTSPVQFATYALAYDPSTPTSNYSLSPADSTMSNAAGSGKITVTAGTTCVWLAKSSASWLTLASSAAVTGNGTVSYSVAANTASVSRTGTITLTNKNSNVVGTFTVTQQALPVTYAVTGTVKSTGSTASAIAGASVSFAGKTATTAGNGTFSISGVAAGTYALAISAPGYAPYTSGITLNANQTIVAALTPGSYTLTGTIRNGSPTGPGLAGATVAVAGKSATTASNGTFSISGVGSGTYTMVVSKTGYISALSQPFTMNTNLVAALYLMPQTYSVSGTVTSAGATGSNPAALSGAIVSIAGQTALTGSIGTFSISGLAPGTYPVIVTKTGYASYSGSITVSANQAISIVMTPATYTLSGTIHTGSMTGSGLAGATVSVAGKTATTASNGTFSINGIPAGSYSYTVTKSGYASYTSGTFAMSSNLAAATYLVPLPTAYTLSGTVKSMTSSGPAIPGATVYLGGQTLTTSSAGTFTATGIAAGTYPFYIVAQGYGIYTANITITANQTLTFCMAPLSYTLSGTITNGSLPGAGLAGATVTLAGQTATTNSAGGFSISGLAAGIYTLSASKSGYAAYANNTFSVGANQSVTIPLKPSATTGGH